MDFHNITMIPGVCRARVVYGSCLGKKNLADARHKGEWANCLEITRGQQETQAISLLSAESARAVSLKARQMVLRQQNVKLGATPKESKGTIHTTHQNWAKKEECEILPGLISTVAQDRSIRPSSGSSRPCCCREDVGDVFLETLSPLVPTEHSLNSMACPRIVPDNVCLFYGYCAPTPRDGG